MKHILSEAYFLRILFYLRPRRKQNNAFLYLIHALIFECKTIRRSVWTKPHTKRFWNENVSNYWTNKDWLQKLRINKETSNICEEIRIR